MGIIETTTSDAGSEAIETTSISKKELDSNNDNESSGPPIVLFIVMGCLAFCCIFLAIIAIKCNQRSQAYHYDEGTIIHGIKYEDIEIEKIEHNITPIMEENEDSNDIPITPGATTRGNEQNNTPGGGNDDNVTLGDDAGSFRSNKPTTLGEDDLNDFDEFALPMNVSTSGGTDNGKTKGQTDNGHNDFKPDVILYTASKNKNDKKFRHKGDDV